jgi:hypothetical protein
LLLAHDRHVPGPVLGETSGSSHAQDRLVVTQRLVAATLALIAIALAVGLARRARGWNDELALVPAPLASEAPRIDDPHTPRLARRVVLVVIDGLGAGESRLPYLDELRARGASAVARTSYPSISRPNYVTILSGVPPRDSGVRTNSVREPTGVDAIMNRAHAAGLIVATASDFGSFASLFPRPIAGLRTPPFDDVRRLDSLDELGVNLAELAHGDAALVAILALDVDRAGHAHGVGGEYRSAAAAVDRMLRAALSGSLDLTRDTVIITADHGHVAPGGHGGLEPEVMQVPLVLAGAGIVPGAAARDARLIDVAPTVAALLGIPPPGHAEGRALVEVLALSPDEAARRAAGDAARATAVIAVTDAVAKADDARRPELGRIAAAVVLALVALALAYALRRRRIASFSPVTAFGVIGFFGMLVAEAIVVSGRPSPSYVPTLARAELAGTIGAVAAIAVQLVATFIALRRAAHRSAAVIGLAVVGLGVSLGAVSVARAWFSPPFIDVPSPFWLVAIPALDLAAATSAAGIAILLAVAAMKTSLRAGHGA